KQKRFAMELRLPQSAQLQWEAMCRRSTLGEDRWTKLATILLRQELGAQPQRAAWHSLAISKLQGTNCHTALEKTRIDLENGGGSRRPENFMPPCAQRMSRTKRRSLPPRKLIEFDRCLPCMQNNIPDCRGGGDWLWWMQAANLPMAYEGRRL